jgi:aspartate ammonia-lyase
LGGTAIGSSINASPKYIKAVYRELNKISKGNFRSAENLMSKTSSQTDFLIISQSIVALTADLSKIANDFKLLSSGPKGGFGEIILPELQQGSSIMPGKVNPIMPELINQLYFIVSGNNLTIERCAEASQLELGVMLPTISDRLIESVKTTIEALSQFTKLCVSKIKANKARCKLLLENSTAYATLLSPKLGYDAVSEIVKEALRSNKTIRQTVLEKKLLTNKEFDNLTKGL